LNIQKSKIQRIMQALSTPSWIRAAIFLWIIYIVSVAIVVAVNPDRRTVTPNYRQAAEKWWLGQEDIYKNKKKGFLYFPHAGILYTPFVLPPKPVGEALWRIVSMSALAFALWRMGTLLNSSSTTTPPIGNCFAALTLLTLPASFASAANGQMNIILIALFLHTAVDLAQERYKASALWLSLAVALKPLAFVYVLLSGTLYKRFRLPLLAGLLVTALIPFIHPNTDYVLRQFDLCREVLNSARLPDFYDFCDLSGMFRKFGLVLPDALWTGIRALAAMGTLAACWLALKKQGARMGSLTVVAWASLYLMLFNPRTEANTYIMLAPMVAIMAVREILELGRKNIGLLLVAICILLGCDSYGPLHPLTNLWLKALLGCVFGVYLIRSLWHPERESYGAVSGPMEARI
jgi:hypothetical protein